MRQIHVLAAGLTALALAGCGGAGSPGANGSRAAKAPIDHVIVIYQENHSFDNLYGTFPGAEGLAQAGNTAVQVDQDGHPFETLPAVTNTNLNPPDPAQACLTHASSAPAPPGQVKAVIDTGLKPTPPDPRFPILPNGPFDIGKHVPPDQRTGDLVHKFYQEQMQIDDGKMDKFAAVSDARGLTMGYYDGSKLPLWTYAQQYVLADHFFHAAFGGSFLNHFWLVAANTPRFASAPTDIVAKLDTGGSLVKDGAVTPDGFGVNTLYSANTPHPCYAKPEQLMPVQTMPHIGDRLDSKSLTWAWYSGGWNGALAGNPDPLFQFHHQVFAYFQDLADDTDAKAKHLKDEQDFFAALQTNALPNVVFIKPLGPDNEHPGYADTARGDQHAAGIIRAVQDSSYWKSSAIIVTYDENGGLWDHVAPPKVDRWGPGTRVPTIIVSPYAKKGFVDHTTYDTTSILRFIEWRWDLQPLAERDAKANNLLNAFDFSQQA